MGCSYLPVWGVSRVAVIDMVAVLKLSLILRGLDVDFVCSI